MDRVERHTAARNIRRKNPRGQIRYNEIHIPPAAPSSTEIASSGTLDGQNKVPKTMRKREINVMNYHDNKPSQLKIELFHMFRFVEALRKMKPDMPLQLASVFLLIAIRPGISQSDIVRTLPLSQAGVSRNVTALTAIDRHGKPGLNFVVQHRDPTDARNTMLRLTDQGHAFLRKIVAVFRDKSD